MATQDTRSILVTNTHPQRGFRLLELTPELEELLTSQNAPTLELKSPSTALAHATDPMAQEYVNLCTPTQTYRIRQVQSSNSLHLLLPSLGHISRDDIKVVEDEAGETGALNLPDEAVTSIAKCASTLELHVPAGGFSAIPFLEKSLRLYDPRSGDDEDGDMTMDRGGGGGWYRGSWDGGGARGARTDIADAAGWRPSARVRLNVWKRLVEGALLQGIDLEKQFLVGDLWKSVLDEDETVEPPFPRGLLEAVARKLCAADQRPLLTDDIKWACFDKLECTQWVGETYLAATAPTASSAIGRNEFLRAWKDCLPESWRGDAVLSKLPEGMYQSPDPATICFVEPSLRQLKSSSKGPISDAKAKAKITRNWHELLKNSKRS
ncbi:Sister chromatid cohesion protein Dcc1 [Penicillium capsulatum]|uniref:Sister chromatid cohesion protein Dcc1 n=1 Tax=Penicillium capsulatum TaxID=69766 RepID=A0A9W9I126_9EURO|nr:Sister chromatid cohesion protein Dcc1 [Penicillium capsulatum]